MNDKRSLWDQFRDSWPAPDCPIYDLHGHWGSNRGIHITHADDESAAAYLVKAGIKRLIICHHHSLFSPDIGNKVNVSTVRKFPDILRAYCAINPNYPEAIKQDLASFDSLSDVFVGLKMLASYHGVELTDERYRPAWEFANERSLMVLSHTWGGDRTCGYHQICAVAEAYPNVRLLLGHCLHGEWDQAVEAVNTYPNVYLDLCAVLDDRGMVEKFVAEAGSRKIVFGTDFPWFGHYYYVGALMGADISDDARRDILYRNAMRLLGEVPAIQAGPTNP